jgi:toxin CptA
VEIVQMMPGSTLWPFFSLLRLRQQNKKMIVVPFFWGSLSPQLFRRLSIACRWIAARNDIQQSACQADFQ